MSRRETSAAIPISIAPFHQSADVGLLAVNATDAAEEMWKTVQVARFFQVFSTHDWRKSQDFRVGLADPSDEGPQAFYDFVEKRRSSEDLFIARRLQQGMS